MPDPIAAIDAYLAVTNTNPTPFTGQDRHQIVEKDQRDAWHSMQ